MDAETGRIEAVELTGHEADDGSRVGQLLDQVTDPLASFTGDGAYDRADVYAAVAARHPEAAVVVPPRRDAVPSDTAETTPTQRDRHLRSITERGRMGWQKASGIPRCGGPPNPVRHGREEMPRRTESLADGKTDRCSLPVRLCRT